MNFSSKAKTLCLLTLIGMLFIPPLVRSQQSDPKSGTSKPIVITAERTAAGVSYKVDSSPVTDLLLSLNKLEGKRGPNCPVIALVDPRLRIEEMWDIDGVAGKAQLRSVRFFVAFHETGKMSEVKLMPAVELSTNPSIN